MLFKKSKDKITGKFAGKIVAASLRFGSDLYNFFIQNINEFPSKNKEQSFFKVPCEVLFYFFHLTDRLLFLTREPALRKEINDKLYNALLFALHELNAKASSRLKFDGEFDIINYFEQELFNSEIEYTEAEKRFNRSDTDTIGSIGWIFGYHVAQICGFPNDEKLYGIAADLLLKQLKKISVDNFVISILRAIGK